MTTQVKQTETNKRVQSKVGIVKKISGSKTISVTVSTRKAHPMYKKIINSSKSYLVHDPKEEASVGDKVKIVLCRPISAKKRWRLDSIITG